MCQLPGDKHREVINSVIRAHKLSIAITFLNRMGDSHSHSLSDLAKEVGTWCTKKRITKYVEHLPGLENTCADFSSANCSSRAQSDLVPTIAEQPSGCPNLLPPIPEIVTSPTGQNLVKQGHFY